MDDSFVPSCLFKTTYNVCINAIFWSLNAHFTLSQFVYWVICFEEWWACLVSSCYWAEPWHQWSTHAASAGTEFRFWSADCTESTTSMNIWAGYINRYVIWSFSLCQLKGISFHCLANNCWWYNDFHGHAASGTVIFPRECNVMQLKRFRVLYLFWLTETSPDKLGSVYQ